VELVDHSAWVVMKSKDPDSVAESDQSRRRRSDPVYAPACTSSALGQPVVGDLA
jgi:hypothetical protein